MRFCTWWAYIYVIQTISISTFSNSHLCEKNTMVQPWHCSMLFQILTLVVRYSAHLQYHSVSNSLPMTKDSLSTLCGTFSLPSIGWILIMKNNILLRLPHLSQMHSHACVHLVVMIQNQKFHSILNKIHPQNRDALLFRLIYDIL